MSIAAKRSSYHKENEGDSKAGGQGGSSQYSDLVKSSPRLHHRKDTKTTSNGAQGHLDSLAVRAAVEGHPKLLHDLAQVGLLEGLSTAATPSLMLATLHAIFTHRESQLYLPALALVHAVHRFIVGSAAYPERLQSAFVALVVLATQQHFREVLLAGAAFEEAMARANFLFGEDQLPPAPMSVGLAPAMRTARQAMLQTLLERIDSSEQTGVPWDHHDALVQAADDYAARARPFLALE
eukprot:m.66784 g.66784  ORF g.66784 m.66784 type:complete len:238 (+) comp12664_c0_seq1:26-739(+)